MAVISISLTESSEQVVAGVPRFVSLAANLPSTIFYTLDGSAPTLYSDIYTDKIQIPTNLLKVVLRVFATNGTDSSPILDFEYESKEFEGGVRFFHSGTDAQPNDIPSTQPKYPFGSNGYVANQKFTGTQNAGLNTNDPSLPSYPSGFDANGNPTGFSNQDPASLSSPNFPKIFPETTDNGKSFGFVGTLPKSTIFRDPKIPSQDDLSNKLFDPKALVIFQDFTQPNDPEMPVVINRAHFTLENVGKVRDGNQYFNHGIDSPTTTGSFLRQHYNPTDQTMTYYYFDSSQNRWIISKTEYKPKPDDGRLYTSVIWSNKPGGRFVFKWIPFKGNVRY
jgi:hypothetical protein